MKRPRQTSRATGGSAAWARLHRPTAARTPKLRADPLKYRRMVIATCVRGGVTLARVWAREGE